MVNVGIAAHITAASPGGARYDPNCTDEKRRSESNGIWVCRKHGTEINVVSSTYSVEALRGLRDIRERIARNDLQRQSTADDDSSTALIEFPYVETELRLIEIISPQPYNYSTASSLHNLLAESPVGPGVLELVPEVIISIWDTRPDVAGILATVLCNAINLWHPTPQLLNKLRDLCRKALDSDDWSRVASVEPLAFAIAAQGETEMHRIILDRIVSSSQWREKDIIRVREYYGTVGVELGAILRHWRDPLRKGTLRANDVGRLMDMIMSNDKLIAGTPQQRSLLDLLLEHARVLSDAGAHSVSRSVSDFVEAFRFPQRS